MSTPLVGTPLLGMPQGAEWLIILAIVILVFGAAKLPDLARGTGQALRIFKAETKGIKDDDPTPPAQPPGELPSGQSDPGAVQESHTDQHRQTDQRP